MLGYLYGEMFDSKIAWASFLNQSFYTYLPMKMEQTECSETSTYKIQTPGQYPEESIQHSEHSKSLESVAACFARSMAIHTAIQ